VIREECNLQIKGSSMANNRIKKIMSRDGKQKMAENLFFVFAFVFFSSLGFHCEDHKVTDGYEPRFVAGIVTDSLMMFPIEGAQISHDSLLERSLAVTDSAGHYVAFSGAPNSNIQLFCGKAGYRTQKRIYSTVSQETTIVDFSLAPE